VVEDPAAAAAPAFAPGQSNQHARQSRRLRLVLRTRPRSIQPFDRPPPWHLAKRPARSLHWSRAAAVA